MLIELVKVLVFDKLYFVHLQQEDSAEVDSGKHEASQDDPE